MAKREAALPNIGRCKLLLRKAEKLEGEEKWQEALEVIQEVIRLEPSYSAEIHSRKGALLVKLGNFKDSVVAYCVALNMEEGKGEREAILCGLKYPLDRYLALNWQKIQTSDALWEIQGEGKKLTKVTGLSQRLYLAGDLLWKSHTSLEDARMVLEASKKTAEAGQPFLYYVYGDLAQLSMALNRDQETLNYLKLKLSSSTNVCHEMSSCQAMGMQLCILGRYDEGKKYFDKAMKIASLLQGFGEQFEMIRILIAIQITCGTMELKGEIKKAIVQYENILQNLSRFDETIRSQNELEVTYNLGEAYNTIGDSKKACEKFRQALHLCERCQHSGVEKYTLLDGLSHSLIELGKYKEAFENAKQLLKVTVEMQNRKAEARACSLLGSIYETFGDYRNAIKYHERDLAISLEVGDKKGTGPTLTNLGVVYKSAGDYEKAVECFEQRLEVARECKDEDGEMKAHANLGHAYSALKDHRKADVQYERYEDFLAGKKRDDRYAEAKLYLFRGKRLHSDHIEAVSLLKKGLEIARRMGWKELESLFLCNLGAKYMNGTTQNIQEARSCFQQAKTISHEQGDTPAEAMHTYALANTCIDSGNFTGAESELKKCVELYERIRKKMRGEESLQIPIQDVQKDAYKLLQIVQIALKKYEEALLTAEGGRARAISDALQLNSPADQSPTMEDIRSCPVDSPVIFYSLGRRGLVFIWIIRKDGNISFRSQNFTLPSETSRTVSNLEEEVEQLCKEMSRKIYVTSDPDLVESKPWSSGPPSSLARNSRSKAIVGPLQRRRFHKADRTPSAEDESGDHSDRATEKIKGMYKAIDERLCTRDIPREFPSRKMPSSQSDSDDLYEVLIGSVQDELVGCAEIVIVPEGPLYKLPFSALRDRQGRYLSETVRIRMVPSLTTLQFLAKRRRTVKCKNFLIAGDPDVGSVQVDGESKPVPRLPGANRECEMIGQMLGATPLTGDKATKTAVLERLGQAQLIHLAAHGLPDTGEILLAPESHDPVPQREDFLLQMSDVQAVKLRAQLVVLSCCDSGRGEIRTEGVIGIARSFLAAGARAVLVSLWAIDDNGTFHFMHSFYTNLKAGMTASEAQHQAMADMRKSEEFQKEKYWAPFVLLGDDVKLSF